jgi:O-antigen ligase
MQTQISAIAYVSAALLLGMLLTRSATSEPWYKAAFLTWFLSVVVAFTFSETREVVLIFLGAILLFLNPRSGEQKLPFVLLIFCAIPTSVAASVPFPFINYLLNADFQLMIGLLIILPILISGQKPLAVGERTTNIVDFFFLSYFALTTCLMIRVLPFTSVVRLAVETFFGVVLIYFLIRRFATSEKVLEDATTSLFVLAVILACIGLVSQIKHWNFYGLLAYDARFFKASEVRYGIMRTSATLIPVLFGFFQAVGIVLLLRQRELLGRLPKFGAAIGFLLAIGLVMSMSRGAWLAATVSIGSYILLKSRMSSSSIVGVLVFFAAVLVFFFFTLENFSTDLDPFETFNYRRQLFIASWDQIQSAPLIGDPLYMYSGRFNELYQGEGIVDVVSVYLLIVLQFGIIGLVLYVLAFLFALRGILKLRSVPEGLSQKNKTLIASLGAFLLGYMVLILTVSNTSLVINCGIVLLGLANAACVTLNLGIEKHRNQKHQMKSPEQSQKREIGDRQNQSRNVRTVYGRYR